jgi:hypothetical protein
VIFTISLIGITVFGWIGLIVIGKNLPGKIFESLGWSGLPLLWSVPIGGWAILYSKLKGPNPVSNGSVVNENIVKIKISQKDVLRFAGISILVVFLALVMAHFGAPIQHKFNAWASYFSPEARDARVEKRLKEIEIRNGTHVQ